MNANTLWIRFGDGGTYESHGQDFSALADNLYEHRIRSGEIAWLTCPRNPQAYAKRNNLLYLPPAGFVTPAFGENDYVSLFWGDETGEDLLQPLTRAEQREVVRRLKKLEA